MEFKDNVFVVTGGGNGMGREVTLQLLIFGAKVFAVDISEIGLNETFELAKKLNKNLEIFVGSITDRQGVEQLPQKVLKRFKRVDGLINVAGIIQPFITVGELNYEQIERVFNVNFYGTLYMIKAFLPHLLKNKTTSVIANVSSMGAYVPVPGQAIYGASKAGVKLLTEALFSELKFTNVKVCGIYPGAVATNIAKNSNVEINVSSKKAKSYKTLSPQKAGELILKGIAKEKLRIFVGKDALTMDILCRLMPKKSIDIVEKNMRNLRS